MVTGELYLAKPAELTKSNFSILRTYNGNDLSNNLDIKNYSLANEPNFQQEVLTIVPYNTSSKLACRVNNSNNELKKLIKFIASSTEKDHYTLLMEGIDSLNNNSYEKVKEELRNVAWVNGINIESILQALKYFYELDKLPLTPTFHYDTDTNLFKFIFSKDKERLEIAFSDDGIIYYLYDLYDEYHTHIEGSAYLSDKISDTKRIHKIISLMENFR